MATTQNTYTGNGSTTNYSFTFEYLKQSDVKVTLDTVATTAFTFANATTLSFTSAPANNVAIRIFRDTAIDTLSSTFFPGSAIKAEDLNQNFTQSLYVTQESETAVDISDTTANTAKTTAEGAVTTANSAVTTANSAVTTANSAVTTANSAVTTANTASDTANAASITAVGAAVTANTASANAASAVTTANTASTNASAAVTTANSAATDAATAITTANGAVTTANSATTAAAAAQTTANNAVTTANGAVTTANTASTNSSTAVTTANTASTNASAAVVTANAAAASVSAAVLFELVANVAAIPGSPSDQDYVEVADSTGIQSFSPLSSVPAGFTGASGLTVRIRYDSSASSWVYMSYFANDSEDRYLTKIIPLGSATAPSFAFTGDANTGIYSPGADQVAITTGGTGRLYIDSSGRLLVGTTTEGEANADDLTIASTGNTGITVRSGTSSSGNIFFSDGTSGNDEIRGYVQYLHASNALLLGTNASERMRIDSSGNVGIGTTSPSELLEIKGSNPQFIINGTTTTDAGIEIQNGGTKFAEIKLNTSAQILDISHHETSGQISFSTGASGTERLRIDSSGNVGIGTTSPNKNLAIVKSNPGGDVGLRLHNNTGIDAGTTASIRFTTSPTATYDTAAIIADRSTGSLSFHEGGIERLRIDSSGRLLVGTSSASGYSSSKMIITGAGTDATGSSNLVLQVGQANGSITANEQIGTINFGDTSGYSYANIIASADLAAGSDSPGRLVFSTTADGASSPTERMRIDSSGKTTIQGVTVGRGGSAVSTNTAVGSTALNVNTTGANNVAVGYWSLSAATTASENTSVGSLSLTSNTTGAQNTAIGRNSLRTNTTGSGNVANGYNALYSNTTAIRNVAVGFEALYLNTTGTENTATGYGALSANTTGSHNTSTGISALGANTTGNYNVANGGGALRFNTSGSYNVTTGFEALRYNTTGVSNTANGYQALYNNTTGVNNVSVGKTSSESITTGSNNVAVGVEALTQCTTGGGNIGLGFMTNISSYSPVFSPTTHNNRVVMGHTSVTNAYVKVAWTVTSDERDKMNFAPVPYGLDFVNQLKPTAYQFKVDRDTETPNGDVRYGFKAQDILALEGDNPVIIDTEDADHLKYKGEHLVPVLVNAVQELTVMVKELQAEIKTLKG